MDAYTNNDKFNFEAVFKKCLSNWYWFALSLFIAIATANFMLRFKNTIYQVSGTILIEDETNKPVPEQALLPGTPLVSRNTLENELQLLKSRTLMERVVDSLGIDVTYHVERKFKVVELYKQSPIKLTYVDRIQDFYGKSLRIKPIDDARFGVIRNEGDTLQYNYNVPFLYDGITFSFDRVREVPLTKENILVRFSYPRHVAAYYSDKLAVRKRSMSNILDITLRDPVPEKAIDIVNTLVKVYNKISLEQKKMAASSSLEFIEKRLETVTNELFQIESQEENFRISNVLPSSTSASAERFMDRINNTDEALVELRFQRNSLTNLESFLRQPANRYESISISPSVAGEALSSLIASYNDLLIQRERLLLSSTASHPQVQNLEKRLESLKSDILNGIQVAKVELEERQKEILADVAPIKEQVQQIPRSERILDQIDRRGQVKEEVYLYLQKLWEEKAIELATQVESARVLDAPINSGPVAPSALHFYLVAFVLGLGIPTGVVAVRERLNDTVQDKADIRSITDMPILGEVAYHRSSRNKVVMKNNKSILAEMFRLVRTNLQFFSANVRDKETLMVTSYLSGEGKTFVTANLGASLALAGKKVVLLEFDLRKPKLSKFLSGNFSKKGITNYVVGEAEIEDIIQPVEGFDSLYVIGCGPIPPNPAELIINERIDALMEHLKRHYDCIILDTPPAGLLTDGLLLSKFVTSTICVVFSGKTKREDLKQLDDLYREQKLPHPALVLNGVKLPKRYGYYY